MKICNKVIDAKPFDNYFVLETDGGVLRIYFLTEDIIRIRAGFGSDFAEESYSLMMTAWPDRMDSLFGSKRKHINAVTPSYHINENTISLEGSKLKVVIDKDPFRICIYDNEGTCLHADIVDLGYQEDSNHRKIHTSEIFDGDYFYGFGEKTGCINKYHKAMSMSPKDAMGYDPKETDSLYKHIPFYIKLNKFSKKASGYFYHTTWECDFDMGKEHSNYWKHHSRFRADGGDIDLFFIAGPSISDVISRYTDLTGKSALLPKYALGYLGSSMYYSELERDCDNAIIDFADTAKEEDIPMDGFQLSSGYTVQNGKRYVFHWNLDRFKDPSDFFTQMEQRGVSVSPNVKPGILVSHPMLSEFIDKDMLVKDNADSAAGIGTWWGGKGVFIDFTKESARSLWKKYLKKNVLEYGTSSVWNDNCEYDSLVDKDCVCDFEGKKGTIGQLKAVMSNLMCKVTEEAIEETHENTRPFIVCRSGHAGIQQYAQTWAGDNYTSWDSLKYNIATILGMGLSGVTNHGCDIGGFYGPAPEAELFVRWVQNGIFQPRFSIHSTNTDNTVTEAWMYQKEKPIIQKAIQFRYQMNPYFYSLMNRAHETGLPIWQPLFAAFQQDTSCYENGIDFLFGDSLLVANVVEKNAKSRSIYFPEGSDFYDFYSRERYTGGQTIDYPVTLDTIPLFFRTGAIVPMAENKLTNLHKDEVTDLHLYLVPTADCHPQTDAFTMYEDDGISLNYQKGEYLKTKITMISGERVSINFQKEGNFHSPVTSVLLDLVHRDKAPFWVSLSDVRLPHFLNRRKFEVAECGWYYSQTLKSVLVKYPNRTQDYEVIVSFEEFDLLEM